MRPAFITAEAGASSETWGRAKRRAAEAIIESEAESSDAATVREPLESEHATAAKTVIAAGSAVKDKTFCEKHIKTHAPVIAANGMKPVRKPSRTPEWKANIQIAKISRANPPKSEPVLPASA
jgi:hypothetical protein